MNFFNYVNKNIYSISLINFVSDLAYVCNSLYIINEDMNFLNYVNKNIYSISLIIFVSDLSYVCNSQYIINEDMKHIQDLASLYLHITLAWPCKAHSLANLCSFLLYLP
jgi:hypothetical protein